MNFYCFSKNQAFVQAYISLIPDAKIITTVSLEQELILDQSHFRGEKVVQCYMYNSFSFPTGIHLMSSLLSNAQIVFFSNRYQSQQRWSGAAWNRMTTLPKNILSFIIVTLLHKILTSKWIQLPRKNG